MPGNAAFADYDRIHSQNRQAAKLRAGLMDTGKIQFGRFADCIEVLAVGRNNTTGGNHQQTSLTVVWLISGSDRLQSIDRHIDTGNADESVSTHNWGDKRAEQNVDS